VSISGITVELSNTGKVFFDDPVITKGDLVRNYRDVAARMLPYLGDRPLVMARYPNGIRAAHLPEEHSGLFPVLGEPGGGREAGG
jgi:bifunctional non-homologous end joining protein LigD